MPNMPNLVNFPGRNDQATERYIDGFGTLFASMGGGAASGRLLGYLFLLPAPVSLEQASRDLDASKSSISVAGRQLEAAGMVRRIRQRGSRRVLFEAVDSFESFVESDNQRRAMFLEKVRQGLELVPEGAAARRLQACADLFQFSIDETREMLRRWRGIEAVKARG